MSGQRMLECPHCGGLFPQGSAREGSYQADPPVPGPSGVDERLGPGPGDHHPGGEPGAEGPTADPTVQSKKSEATPVASPVPVLEQRLVLEMSNPFLQMLLRRNKERKWQGNSSGKRRRGRRAR